MLTIFSDGGSRGNPGHSACAYVIYKDGEVIKQDSKYLGIATNNYAEYNGVILALEGVVTLGMADEEITFKMDSELVVKQLNGEYKIKNKELIDLAMKVKLITAKEKIKIRFIHVFREENHLADKMVNEKLDKSSRL